MRRTQKLELRKQDTLTSGTRYVLRQGIAEDQDYNQKEKTILGRPH